MAAEYTYTIIEYDYERDFPLTGSVDTIYIDTSRNLAFRWNGEYIQVSNTDSYIWGILGTALKTKIPYTGATQNVDLGEYELKAGQVEFDQTPTGTAGVAVLRWNDADGTLDLGLKGGNVTLQIGQEQVTRVVNKTGSDLLEANYQAVRISGAQGNRLKVDLAQANNDANSAETLGIITETIANNQEGFITTSGLVRGINTTGSLQSETWADGDMLYLSGTTAGRITNVKPSAPIHTIIMGYVVRAHSTQGQIYVKVDNGYELDELHNVSITSPTNGQTLVYDSATSLWKNGASGGGSATWGSITGTLSSQTDLQTALNAKVPTTRTLTINGTALDLSADRSWTIANGLTIGTTAIASGTIGRVLFQGTGNVLQQSSSLFWDDSIKSFNISANQNAQTLINISNTTNGTAANAALTLTSDTNSGFFNSFKVSSTYTTYKTLVAKDAGFYNSSNGGDFSFLNDNSTGRFKISTGGSTTAQFIVQSNGNIGINTTTDAGYKLDVNGTTRIQNKLSVGTPSAASALMEITSTTLGFLPPRMTTIQKNAISSPAAGLIVYDTTLNKLCVRTASAWETITSV